MTIISVPSHFFQIALPFHLAPKFPHFLLAMRLNQKTQAGLNGRFFRSISAGLERAPHEPVVDDNVRSHDAPP
jgi:hypothetical protein